MVESTNKQPASEFIMKNTTLKSLFKPDVDGIQDKNVTRFMIAIRMVTNKKGDKPGTLYRKLQKPDGKKITKSDLIDIPKKPLTLNDQGNMKQIPVRQLYLKSLAEQVEVPDKPTDDNLLQSTPYKYIQEEADVKSNATEKQTKKDAKAQAKKDAEKAQQEAEQAEIDKAKKEKEDAELEKQKVEAEIAKAKKDKEDAELEKQKVEAEVAKIKRDQEEAQQKIQQQQAELAKSKQQLAGLDQERDAQQQQISQKNKEASEIDAQNKAKQADLDEHLKKFTGLSEQQKQIEKQRYTILNNLATQIKSKLDKQYFDEQYDPRGTWENILDPIIAIQPSKQNIQYYQNKFQQIDKSQQSMVGLGWLTGQSRNQINKIQEYLSQLIPTKDVIDIGTKLSNIILTPEDTKKYEKQTDSVNQQHQKDLEVFGDNLIRIPELIQSKQLFGSDNQPDKRGTWDQLLKPFTKTQQNLIRGKVQELGDGFVQWFIDQYGNENNENIFNYYKQYKPVDEQIQKDEESKFNKKQIVTVGDIQVRSQYFDDGDEFVDAIDVEQSAYDLLEHSGRKLTDVERVDYVAELNRQIQSEQIKEQQQLQSEVIQAQQPEYIDMMQALNQPEQQQQQVQMVEPSKKDKKKAGAKPAIIAKDYKDEPKGPVMGVFRDGEFIEGVKITKGLYKDMFKLTNGDIVRGPLIEKQIPRMGMYIDGQFVEGIVIETDDPEDDERVKGMIKLDNGDIVKGKLVYERYIKPKDKKDKVDDYKSDNEIGMKQQLRDKQVPKQTANAVMYVYNATKNPEVKLALFNQVGKLTAEQLTEKYRKYETLAQAEKNAIKQEVAQFVALKDKFMKDLLVKKQRK